MAIKKLDHGGGQGNQEFLVELMMLCLLHHENLVNLIGYCVYRDQRLLVYEYMPLGSLDTHLFGMYSTNLWLPFSLRNFWLLSWNNISMFLLSYAF